MFSNAATAPWSSNPWLAERRSRERWERDVRSSRHGGESTWWRRSGPTSFGSGISFSCNAAVGTALRLQTELRIRARHVLLALSATAAAATAFAAVVAIKAYADNPPSSWAWGMTQRRHSPIWDSEGRLAGSVGSPDAKLDLETQRNFAFIPLSEAPPPTFVAALQQLEDRNFGVDSWRSWCGIDAPAMVWRWVSSGGVAGGSGLLQQHTRQMKSPEWGNEKTLFEKATRKFRELGAACSVWTSYENAGGAAAILKDYASTAPMLQGGGTLRGLESAAYITWGVKPAELTDAQQALFASSVRLPMRLLQPGDLDVNCGQVYPKSSPGYDASLANAHPARLNQCRVLARAIGVAPKVLQGDRLAAALRELHALQRDGIHVVNDFQPVSARRLINLTGRTVEMVPATVTRMMIGELDDLPDFAWGTPLHLTIDAAAERSLNSDMHDALRRIEKTGKGTLCMPLSRTEPFATGFTRVCGVGVADGVSADVFAMKMNVSDGTVVGVYASTPLLMDSPLSAGSVAKLVIALAAVRAGIDPQSLWCPRRLRDGTRQLRRVGAAPYGYTDNQCARGKHNIRLVDAIARSDNLAIAEVARRLGDDRLRAALDALGLKAERDKDVWYPLSFGTQPATPRTLLAAGRALVAAAYGIKLVGSAPRVLLAAGDQAALGGEPIVLNSLSSAARDSLRTLLEAPVAVERGTLGFVSDAITAGKTGTTSSSTFDVNGHRNVHAKLALTYQADQRALNLLIVSAPKPSVPLALHDMPGSLLAPAHRALLQPR